MTDFSLAPTPGVSRRKRLRKDPKPRFKDDLTDQLDAVGGCSSIALAGDHLARGLRSLLDGLDYGELEAKYSSQGRRGFHPRHVVGVLVYGSLIGVHHSTKLATRLESDLALRFMAGGHAISAGVLRRFRRENREFFEEAHGWTVRAAHEQKLLDPEQLAVDSVRLRAHASTNAVRTVTRSRKRLEELSAVEVAKLDDQSRAEHLAKVLKHKRALELCDEAQRPNIVLTNPGAGLMKFPNGASAPGHRATVTAAGTKLRLVVSVLIDADGNDYGKLGPALLKARATLREAGVILDKQMQAAADAGYFSERDLAFASENREWVDVLINEGTSKQTPGVGKTPVFNHSAFIKKGESLICPAGRSMDGPYADGKGKERWQGVGCENCALKPQCTTSKHRQLVIDHAYNKIRNELRERMARPGARERYNERIATVEPVFSYLEDVMNFRRVSTRHLAGAAAEIMLKVFAYNVSRLLAAKKLIRVYFVVAIGAVGDA